MFLSLIRVVFSGIVLWNCGTHSISQQRKRAEESIEQREERIESSMDTGQERRKHWYALSSTNLWIGFTWYWISKFTSFFEEARPFASCCWDFNSSCINANYYVCQAKKIIGDSTDSFRKRVTIYFHAYFIAFIIFCSRVTLCDGILYMSVATHGQFSKS